MNVWEKQQAFGFSETLSHWASVQAKGGRLYKASALNILAERQKKSRYDLRPHWMGCQSEDWTHEQFLAAGFGGE